VQLVEAQHAGAVIDNALAVEQHRGGLQLARGFDHAWETCREIGAAAE
jgi:hypothetical protein